MDGASYMPGVYKIPMVRMTEMSDEAPECKGLKAPHSEMGVWVKAQAVRFSRNGCYETPWHVTGVSKLSGPEGTPKGMYVQIGLSEQGKAGSLLDNPAKNNKRMNSCRKAVVEPMISSAKKRTVRNGHKSGKTSAVHNHYSCSRVRKRNCRSVS